MSATAKRARILAPTPENLEMAAEALRRGECVAIPTETVYGLAASAFDPNALARVFDLKERPSFDPLIIHVSLGQMARRCEDLERLGVVDAKALSAAARDRADRLMAAFWPGPLTLVLPKRPKIPDLATSGLPTVGVRMPDHPVAQALIALAGFPLAAPSANRFGRISPTTARAASEELGDRIDIILDGGPCRVGLESTVLSIAIDGELALLRPGGVSREDLEQIAGVASGSLRTLPVSTSRGSAQSSPGMLESHYAPAKPVFLLPTRLEDLSENEWDSWRKARPELRAASSLSLLLVRGSAATGVKQLSRLSGKPVEARTLSASGDDAEAARGLFSLLRELDELSAPLILAEPYPGERGLAYAIADRIRRAATKR